MGSGRDACRYTTAMSAVVYVNGTIRPEAEATIPVFDHGFLYGEGVYETLRTYRRRPFLFDRHMIRLRQSAAMLALPVPFSDADLEARVDETLAAHPGFDEAYIRILLTRGVGDLSYALSASPTPSLVIIVKPLPTYPERTFTEGIRLAVVDIHRNHPHALNPAIKSNNLLNNAMAMQEAYARGAEEALMLNHDGDLVECSQSNVFVVRDGEVATPPLAAGLLRGITRAVVLELTDELGIRSAERRVTLTDMASADEVFITGTTREVTPVASIDGRRVGSGMPGPITSLLLARYRARAHAPRG